MVLLPLKGDIKSIEGDLGLIYSFLDPDVPQGIMFAIVVSGLAIVRTLFALLCVSTKEQVLAQRPFDLKECMVSTLFRMIITNVLNSAVLPCLGIQYAGSE